MFWLLSSGSNRAESQTSAGVSAGTEADVSVTSLAELDVVESSESRYWLGVDESAVQSGLSEMLGPPAFTR
jgi:hypothetical protein